MKNGMQKKIIMGQTAAVVGFVGFGVLMFLLRGEIRHLLGVPPGAILMIVSASVAAGTAMVFMRYLGNGSRVEGSSLRDEHVGEPRGPERSRRASAPVPGDSMAVTHGQPGVVRGTLSDETVSPSVISVSSGAKDPAEVFASTSLRLRREIAALSRRGNLNLTIGVITTGFALGLLAYMIFDESTSPDSFAAAISHYLPRVTTTTFIEVFSFFFLRLYRTSLEEIKFYQNELTSLAGHQIALETSRQTSDPACLRQVLAEISRHNPNGSYQPSATSRQPDASPDDGNLKNAMNLLERVSTLVASSRK